MRSSPRLNIGVPKNRKQSMAIRRFDIRFEYTAPRTRNPDTTGGRLLGCGLWRNVGHYQRVLGDQFSEKGDVRKRGQKVRTINRIALTYRSAHLSIQRTNDNA